MLRISILTLFPDFFQMPLDTSILARAKKQGLVRYDLVNLRDFATDKRRTTDDRPFGGGPGMVMMVEPIDLALKSVSVEPGGADSKILLLSAKGKLFDQPLATELSQLKHLVLICGHYQDVDQRVVDHLIDGELSVGNFILTGGEAASLIVVDAVTRLLPGVLGNESSLADETHARPDFVAPPAYTRPAKYRGWQVPEVLLSGNHKKIEEFKESERRR